MKVSLLALAAITIPLSGMAGAPSKAKPSVPVSIGEKLPAANAKLLKAGWKPVRWQRKDDDPEWSANARVFFDAGFVGVEDCAGTGVNPCLFRYKNERGECLTLETTGELPKDAPVTHWDYSCPDASSK